MPFTPFEPTDNPSMANFNQKFADILAQTAPAGYGLGTGAVYTADLDSLYGTGWYIGIPAITGFDIGNTIVHHIQYNASYAIQTGYLLAETSGYMYKNVMIRRVKEGDVWGAWEWVNPPMLPGGVDNDENPINEYRTTERYHGKAVYAMLVNCGAWSAGKQVKYISSAKLDTPVSISVQQGGNITYPYIGNGQYALLLQNNIYLGGTEDNWGGTVYALVKYTRAE